MWSKNDGLGRVTQDTEFEYIFDPFDRLVAARPIGQTTWSEQYHYDSLGRLSKLGGSDHPVPVFHAYDGAQLIAAYEQNTLIWEALWADQLDHLLQWRHAPTSTVYLPLRDHRNTIVALHNANTGVVNHLADVDAQGRTTTLFADETIDCQEQGQPGTVCALADIFPFGLNTAWRSQTTGMLSMRHRWYSPTLGQFVSHDPYEYVEWELGSTLRSSKLASLAKLKSSPSSMMFNTTPELCLISKRWSSAPSLTNKPKCCA